MGAGGSVGAGIIDKGIGIPKNVQKQERRCIQRLSFAEKLQVVEYFKNGMKNKDLSEKYKVRNSAISKIIHNKDKILQHKETMEKIRRK
ncbi:hypothetical protein NQ318_017234 [Aromia moschata]|uniref:HTH psq-type domain-containing protein n=1 Tax=Aromia moschata TaxID=1265417 RepID=A0AAV8YPA0_9CUCU|nr:hypothetical protein NQ318_017234 [Aromia moschata]